MILRIDTYWGKSFEPLVITLAPKGNNSRVCSDLRVVMHEINVRMILNKITFYAVIEQ